MVVVFTPIVLNRTKKRKRSHKPYIGTAQTKKNFFAVFLFSTSLLFGLFYVFIYYREILSLERFVESFLLFVVTVIATCIYYKKGDTKI
tara:strand:+ start:23866 stop:24132 length:267 start_codon:yes stop_codon:yes gene_type:complete